MTEEVLTVVIEMILSVEAKKANSATLEMWLQAHQQPQRH